MTVLQTFFSTVCCRHLIQQLMRCILLVLDGLGDKGHACFGGKTPLQAAATPNLDRLASLGMNGLYHSYLQGTAMPSEIAHFLMFGYGLDEFPGRGLLEAMGEGIRIRDDEVYVLARIFSVKRKQEMLILHHESPALDGKTCRTLQKAIKGYQHGAVAIEFIPTRGILGILRLSGGVSAHITDSNPMSEGRPLMEVLPVSGCEDRDKAHATARALNEYLRWCYRTLSKHPLNRERARKGMLPGNAVGTQRPGMKRNLPSMHEKWGLRCLSISSGPVYHGLCSLLGMENHRVAEKADPEKDLRHRLKLAREATDFDFVHVHTKAPDEASHTKDPEHKKAVIETLDRALDYALDEIASDEDLLLVITADHSTASTGSMIHSGETVPLTILGRYARRDEVSAFNEVSCAGGSLGLVRGKELMYLILNFLDRGKLWGTMDSPVNQPYFPGRYRSLRIR